MRCARRGRSWFTEWGAGRSSLFSQISNHPMDGLCSCSLLAITRHMIVPVHKRDLRILFPRPNVQFEKGRQAVAVSGWPLVLKWRGHQCNASNDPPPRESRWRGGRSPG